MTIMMATLSRGSRFAGSDWCSQSTRSPTFFALGSPSHRSTSLSLEHLLHPDRWHLSLYDDLFFEGDEKAVFEVHLQLGLVLFLPLSLDSRLAENRRHHGVRELSCNSKYWDRVKREERNRTKTDLIIMLFEGGICHQTQQNAVHCHLLLSTPSW